MNYRKFYEKCTGVRIPKGYEVHHLDGNRMNNQIVNLVAIPKQIHRDFHKENIKAIKTINDLNNYRCFGDYIDLECLDIWKGLRTKISSYEGTRDGQCYNNGVDVKYSSDGVQNFFKSKI